MQIGQDEIKSLVHKLVGLQVFSGYINWDKGVLYSDEAQQLRELDKCRNCGGEIQLAGKGVMTCKYCGTEYFVS
jgi:tRNA(Ile2) C34 agmatinyltransferase TiaS